MVNQKRYNEYSDLVDALDNAQFDIRKGTDQYRGKLTDLPLRVASDYDSKKFIDSLDRAALEANRGNFEPLTEVLSEVNTRFAYAVGLSREARGNKDRERNIKIEEDMEKTVGRGREYIRLVQTYKAARAQREQAGKLSEDLVEKLKELEAKLAA